MIRGQTRGEDEMATQWRGTLHGGWIRDYVGLVAEVEARGWYAYPFRGGLPRGPFSAAEEAMKALDQMVADRQKGERVAPRH
jgi:hypothetical protein